MRIAERRTAAKSMNATFNDAAFGLENMEGYSITAAVTETSATLSGTLKLQACNDAFLDRGDLTEDSGATWVDLTGSSQSVSSSGNFMWNVVGSYYSAVRVVWTRSGGQGTAKIIYRSKGPQS